MMWGGSSGGGVRGVGGLWEKNKKKKKKNLGNNHISLPIIPGIPWLWQSYGVSIHSYVKVCIDCWGAYTQNIHTHAHARIHTHTR